MTKNKQKTLQLKPRRKAKTGRKRGTVNISRFDETKIGFAMKWKAPVEYDLLMDITLESGVAKPDWRVINRIGAASQNPFFETDKYIQYLVEYKWRGLYIPKPKKVTSKMIEKIKKKKLSEANS